LIINSQEWIDSNIEHLTEGEIEISGRLVDASNATLFGSITRDAISVDVIYKPMAGERPLWDFPDGTLADREYSAFLLSRLSGLNLVPPTILRDGPAGMGMVQLWIDVDETNSILGLTTLAHDAQRYKRSAIVKEANVKLALLTNCHDTIQRQDSDLDRRQKRYMINSLAINAVKDFLKP
jgi:uncharacterized repeat protein (TIGR03843 family)